MSVDKKRREVMKMGMTREQLKQAKRRSIFRALALTALCVVIAVGASYLADYAAPVAEGVMRL